MQLAAHVPVAPRARCGAAAAPRARAVRVRAAQSWMSQRPDAATDDIRDTIKHTRLITALKTPYRPDGSIDMAAYDRHVENQLASGVEGFIVGGTTGEGQLMHWDEHVMLIAHTVNKFGGRAIVIGNTGSNSTREALHASEQGFNVGMHASLQINPYYGKTSPKGIVSHISAALDVGPGIVYNVPGRTGQDIRPDLIRTLAEHPNFLGVKECAGRERIKTYSAEGIMCWSGNDDECHDSRHYDGGLGVISVGSNILPGVWAEMMKQESPELNASVQELCDWLFHEPNPIPVNTAMAMLGLCEPVFRLPYVPVEQDQRKKGIELLTPFLDRIPGAKGVRDIGDEEWVLVRRAP
ncbi:unnamed protein product [Pedinophyceae sp. YPF-701]|nr:unnamed protein product [Pedinophyceae sp. YPF-701]